MLKEVAPKSATSFFVKKKL